MAGTNPAMAAANGVALDACSAVLETPKAVVVVDQKCVSEGVLFKRFDHP
jgi:hypothetical protein